MTGTQLKRHFDNELNKLQLKVDSTRVHINNLEANLNKATVEKEQTITTLATLFLSDTTIANKFTETSSKFRELNQLRTERVQSYAQLMQSAKVAIAQSKSDENIAQLQVQAALTRVTNAIEIYNKACTTDTALNKLLQKTATAAEDLTRIKQANNQLRYKRLLNEYTTDPLFQYLYTKVKLGTIDRYITKYIKYPELLERYKALTIFHNEATNEVSAATRKVQEAQAFVAIRQQELKAEANITYVESLLEDSRKQLRIVKNRTDANTSTLSQLNTEEAQARISEDPYAKKIKAEMVTLVTSLELSKLIQLAKQSHTTKDDYLCTKLEEITSTIDTCRKELKQAKALYKNHTENVSQAEETLRNLRRKDYFDSDARFPDQTNTLITGYLLGNITANNLMSHCNDNYEDTSRSRTTYSSSSSDSSFSSSSDSSSDSGCDSSSSSSDSGF